jgi:hypothetical protein
MRREWDGGTWLNHRAVGRWRVWRERSAYVRTNYMLSRLAILDPGVRRYHRGRQAGGGTLHFGSLVGVKGRGRWRGVGSSD